MAQYGGYDNRDGYGQANPYNQGDTYNYQQTSQPTYGGQQNGTYAGGNDMEMGAVNGRGRDPNAILDEISDMDRGMDTIGSNLATLKELYKDSINDPDTSQNTRTNREIDALNAETMNLYRNFADRLKKIKAQPASREPRNDAQVRKVTRKLDAAITEYRKVDKAYRDGLKEKTKRLYRVVNPAANEQEVEAAANDPSNGGVFEQALLSSNRRGQSQTVLREVQQRHQAIQKIAQQMEELGQLFQQIDQYVVEQDAPLQQIDEQGERVQEDISRANVQLDGANQQARSRNRKKWWCLLIAILIVIIIVVIVVIVVKVVNPGGKK